MSESSSVAFISLWYGVSVRYDLKASNRNRPLDVVGSCFELCFQECVAVARSLAEEALNLPCPGAFDLEQRLVETFVCERIAQ